MAIGKGVDWGGSASVPDDLVVVDGDAAAGAVLAAGSPYPTIGLLGGDLARTVGGRGGPAARLRTDGVVVTVDVGVAVLDDGPPHRFVAHCIARCSWSGGSWWRGPVVAVMNAQYLGAWDVAPRAHPGDGRLDVLSVPASFPVGDRWKARARLPSGTHVPHPAIEQRRAAEWSVDLGRPTPVRLDGVLVGPARHLTVTVEPDALTVVV